MNIEELAFKDRKTLEQLNKKDLLDIIEFVQLDRKQWINQFSKTHNEKVDIRKENQELKKHLKVPKACSLKTLKDYKSYYEDTTREQILEDTYIEYCAYVNLAHRYSELKKQVEENKDNYNCLLKQKEEFEYIMSKQVDYQGQKKAFIKYLEDEIKDVERPIELLSDTRDNRIPILKYKKHIIEVILAKYKEIIGGNKDEK